MHDLILDSTNSLPKFSPITTYPGGPVDIPLRKAAERLGITLTQVVFLWVRAKGAVIVTSGILSASSERRETDITPR